METTGYMPDDKTPSNPPNACDCLGYDALPTDFFEDQGYGAYYGTSCSDGMPRKPIAKMMENMLELTGAPLALIGATLTQTARTLNLLKSLPKLSGKVTSSGEIAKETPEMEPTTSLPLLPPPSSLLPSQYV